MTCEERLQLLQQKSELLRVLFRASAELRHGQSPSPAAWHEMQDMCADLTEGLNELRQRLPVQVLNVEMSR